MNFSKSNLSRTFWKNVNLKNSESFLTYKQHALIRQIFLNVFMKLMCTLMKYLSFNAPVKLFCPQFDRRIIHLKTEMCEKQHIKQEPSSEDKNC